MNVNKIINGKIIKIDNGTDGLQPAIFVKVKMELNILLQLHQLEGLIFQNMKLYIVIIKRDNIAII